MLRVFSDRESLPSGVGHIEMLYPFWGEPLQAAWDPLLAGYERYLAIGPTLFEMTSLSTADIAVLPFDWEVTSDNRFAYAAACSFARTVQAAGKPLVVFYTSDSDAPIPVPAVVLRTSLTRNAENAREFSLPFWCPDLVDLCCGGRLPVRPRSETPVVGFCGRVPSRNPIRTAAAAIRRRAAWGGTRHMRSALIDALRASSRVRTSVIERAPYFGDVVTSPKEVDHVQARSWRAEYIDNLLQSDYALCPRGIGNNASFRLFEALCCGRIPVLVDTNAGLPYDWDIDWRSYAVWVKPYEMKHIGERIADFNAALSDRAFVELQHACRQLWQDRLSPEGFFRHFHRHFGRSPFSLNTAGLS